VSGAEPGSRAVPYHCPFCASEDLVPAEQHGQWECRTCARAFVVKFVGLVVGL
jgi:ribosomal protein L37AE/L43A